MVCRADPLVAPFLGSAALWLIEFSPPPERRGSLRCGPERVHVVAAVFVPQLLT